MSGQQQHPLRLNDARSLTPPVNPVEAMRRSLAVAAFGAVKETDVMALVAKLHEMALSGDHKAMKMYLELVGVMGKQAPTPAPPSEAPESAAAIGQLAEAMRDLVDEVRISRAPLPARELKKLANGKED